MLLLLKNSYMWLMLCSHCEPRLDKDFSIVSPERVSSGREGRLEGAKLPEARWKLLQHCE